jgi:lauroyl/myristoyl acyltransferase
MPADPDAAFRWAYKRLSRLTLARPGVGLGLAALVGRVAGARAGPGFTLTPDEVRALFGPLPRAAVARIRRRIASEELRNRCARGLVRERGLEVLATRVRVVGGAHLHELVRDKVPVVAVGWHAGAFRSAPLGISRLGISTLVATGKPLGRAAEEAGPLLRYAEMHETTGALAGAQFLKQALSHVAHGGVTVFFADSFDMRGRIWMSFLGRRFPLARGATTLARLSRGRVVPVSSRWIGLGSVIEVRIHEPLPEPAAPRTAALEYETELLRSICRLFEAEVRVRPESMRLWRWRDLLALPLQDD